MIKNKKNEEYVPYLNERNKLGRITIKEVRNLVTQEGQIDKMKLIA